jgi:hypothetical protein
VAARLPKEARVVTFPGGPNPDDVMLGRWNKRVAPYPGRLKHILATFGPASTRVNNGRWRHLKRYVLPVKWIADHWRE